VEKLDHQTGESLEGTWYADRWADFDEHALGGMDVDLKLACLVDRGIEEGKETLRQSAFVVILSHSSANLVSDIRSGITDVAIHLAHDADMFIYPEPRISIAFKLQAVESYPNLEDCISLPSGHPVCCCRSWPCRSRDWHWRERRSAAASPCRWTGWERAAQPGGVGELEAGPTGFLTLRRGLAAMQGIMLDNSFAVLRSMLGSNLIVER